ncbi:hypothetical protein SAV14893_089260 [Streptomyces avermitilis]|uniref:MaoC-like domain-containing protein n=1 Tax=Streptomyces avermitilis TaxID=33903 RepID=A0A4D4MCB1_STRAX|nr:hypothetical protein SAV14893_089260 [Streptomyces avermitilis]
MLPHAEGGGQVVVFGEQPGQQFGARDAYAKPCPEYRGHAPGEVAEQDDPFATALCKATGPLDDMADTLLARARPTGMRADDTTCLLVSPLSRAPAVAAPTGHHRRATAGPRGGSGVVEPVPGAENGDRLLEFAGVVVSINYQVGDTLPRLKHTVTTFQLFRYSAVTWNPHRIHFDEPYAREEGHGGLVAHSHLRAALALCHRGSRPQVARDEGCLPPA